jgi:hypothetical protein
MQRASYQMFVGYNASSGSDPTTASPLLMGFSNRRRRVLQIGIAQQDHLATRENPNGRLR